NANGAEARYKDQVLLVEGPLADLDPDSGGDIVLRLEAYRANPNEPSNEVRCVLSPRQTDQALRSGRGQKITVKGTFAGTAAKLFIDLVDAEIVKTGQDPAIWLRLAKLEKEHAKDPSATAKKYENKQMSFDGVLVELKEGPTADLAILSLPNRGKGARLR